MTAEQAKKIIGDLVKIESITTTEQQDKALERIEALNMAVVALDIVDELTRKDFILGKNVDLIMKPLERERIGFYADNIKEQRIAFTQVGLKFILNLENDETQTIHILLDKKQAKSIGKFLKKISKTLEGEDE